MQNPERITQLYADLIDAWNTRDSDRFAGLFATDALCIGFDGSEMKGRQAISQSLHTIFKDHPTATYVYIIRESKMIGSEVGIVEAHVSMVLPGQSDIDPSKNALQVMLARTTGTQPEIISFQNTPAQFHGRPEVAAQFTHDLQLANHHA